MRRTKHGLRYNLEKSPSKSTKQIHSDQIQCLFEPSNLGVQMYPSISGVLHWNILNMATHE